MGMPFYKVYSDGILRGSLADADNTVQLIWLKLLAIANETKNRDGYLRYSEGHPYSFNYIAETCHVSVDELQKALDLFNKDIRDNIPRISIVADGSIKLNNFLKYQKKPEPKKRQPMPDTQKEGMLRRLVNLKPNTAIDVLSHDFGHTVVDKNGEVLSKDKCNDT